jgi:hypothetical protein
VLRIHSSFFTYYIYIFKYFESVNSKIIDFKIRWDRIHQILIKFGEFVNRRPRENAYGGCGLRARPVPLVHLLLNKQRSSSVYSRHQQQR